MHVTVPVRCGATGPLVPSQPPIGFSAPSKSACNPARVAVAASLVNATLIVQLPAPQPTKSCAPSLTLPAPSMAPPSWPASWASSAYTPASSALASVSSTPRFVASGASGTGVPGFGGTAAMPDPTLGAVGPSRGGANRGTEGVLSRSSR